MAIKTLGDLREFTRRMGADTQLTVISTAVGFQNIEGMLAMRSGNGQGDYVVLTDVDTDSTETQAAMAGLGIPVMQRGTVTDGDLDGE